MNCGWKGVARSSPTIFQTLEKSRCRHAVAFQCLEFFPAVFPMLGKRNADATSEAAQTAISKLKEQLAPCLKDVTDELSRKYQTARETFEKLETMKTNSSLDAENRETKAARIERNMARDIYQALKDRAPEHLKNYQPLRSVQIISLAGAD